MAKRSESKPQSRTARVPIAGGPSRPTAPPYNVVEHEEIGRLAYSYWEARGCQGGSPEEDWFRAEQELQSQQTGPKR